jgi:general stress protein CsbA
MGFNYEFAQEMRRRYGKISCTAMSCARRYILKRYTPSFFLVGIDEVKNSVGWLANNREGRNV